MDESCNYLHKCNPLMDRHVRIVRMGRFYCAPDWSWDTMGVSDWKNRTSPSRVSWNFDLWTVLQGKGQLQTGDQSFDLTGGDCFILQKGKSYSARTDPCNPLVVIAIHYDYLDSNNQLVFPENLQLYHRIHDLEFMTHLLERLEDAWDTPRGEPKAGANIWLEACLAEIGRQDGRTETHGYLRKQKKLIEDICCEIRQNPEKEWNIDLLAKRLNCSRPHFSRLFKQLVDCSPRDYISTIRIEAARGMLHASNYSIGQIGKMLGYQDIYYFSRHFKLRTGSSPSAYRNSVGKLS